MKTLAASIALMVATMATAGWMLLASIESAKRERELLLEFVCASVRLRLDNRGPDAAAWRQAVNHILELHGEAGRCDGD